MKIIWGIFKRDMCHATRNVIAVIVSMGLVVVPALYAWFNIAASWNPYGNTKALKVAVANNDKGYKSDLIPVRVNVGETIISTLHANDQLDWQFVKSDKAIDGVKSGEYYAAIVIPKGFSADMMTLFSPDIKHAQLKYYLNEKINPIAPHITDQGATTVVNTIDKTFAKTIAQVGLDLASSILHYSQSPQMAEYMRNLNGNLTTMADTLSGASQQVTSYSQLLGSANDIVDSTGKLLASATKAGKQAQNALKQGKSGAASFTSAGANVTSSVNTALDQVSGAFDQVAAKVNKAFDAIGKDSDTAASQLTTLSEQVSSSESLYDTYITSLNHMHESVEQLPDSDSAKQALLEAIDREITLLEAAKGDSQKLAQQLKDASTQVTQDTAAAERSRKEILNRIRGRLTAEQEAAYRLNLESYRQLERDPDAENRETRMLDLDNAFHRRAFELCGMEEHFDHMLSTFQHIERLRKFSLQTEENKSVCAAHTRILEAVLRGSEEDLSRALSDHLNRYKLSVEQARQRHPEYFTEGTVRPVDHRI